MTEPHPQRLHSVKELVTSIRGLKAPIEALADPFRQAIDSHSKTLADPRVSPDYWTLVAHADSLVRIRLFTEQNFYYTESVGLLGVTLYLLELGG